MDMPWDDCKVAFSIDNADPFDDHKIADGKLPKNWEYDECDGTGARWVVVFRVNGQPTKEDGLAVKKWLKEIGAIKGKCKQCRQPLSHHKMDCSER